MLNAFKSAIKWIAAIVVICLAAYFLASINGLTVSHKMGKVGNLEVTEAEYKYYLEMTKQNMLAENNIADEEAEKAFWDSEIDGKKASDVAKEDAKQEMIRVLAACNKAEEAGISLTDAEKTSARSILGTDTATKEQVKELEKTTGADKYQLVEIMERQLLANSYAQSVSTQENSPIAVSDDEKAAAVQEKYARVKHVLIQNAPQSEPVVAEDGTEVPAAEPTEEELAAYKEEAKKKADDVLAKAVGGANFEGLVTEFGEDPGMESTPDGYIIDETGASADGSGAMVEEFTKGTFAVKAGEVNPELVESSYGWHIIKRYEIDPASESYQTVLSAVESKLLSEKYEAYIDEVANGLEISINEKVYNKIKVN